MIRAEELTKVFGNKKVVNKVNFTVKKGDIFGFLGPNGSGKSTVIKMLCGLLLPTEGKAFIQDINASEESLLVRKSIGYVSQKFGLYSDLTVKENMEFYGLIYGVNQNDLSKRINEISARIKLTPYINHKAEQLSGGWKQRLALACALLHKPIVLFLDEPTAGIDPVARREVWDLLFEFASEGMTMFVTTHYMDEAERCHEVAYIYLGDLIAKGSVDDLINIPDLYPENYKQIEVSGEPIMKIYALFQEIKEIEQITIFGRHLHCIIPKNLSIQTLENIIKEKTECKDPEILEKKPSLEDVFVALTKKYLS